MHRHSYKGTKFHRERDARRALLKGLADSLIVYETIQTTEPKAKELVPYVEKLITKAKRGDLASRRQLLRDLQTVASAHKLMDEIAPKLKKRTSGHLKIEKEGYRRGDNAALARVSFVDDIKSSKADESDNQPQKQAQKQQHEDTKEKSETLPKPAAARKTPSARATQNVQAPKRTGRRGNR